MCPCNAQAPKLETLRAHIVREVEHQNDLVGALNEMRELGQKERRSERHADHLAQFDELVHHDMKTTIGATAAIEATQKKFQALNINDWSWPLCFQSLVVATFVSLLGKCCGSLTIPEVSTNFALAMDRRSPKATTAFF